jgi:hypothetical protein
MRTDFFAHRSRAYLVGAGGALALGLVAVAVLLVGATKGGDVPTTPVPENSYVGYLAPRPRAVADVVASAELVIIGEIGSVLRQTEEFGVGPLPTPSKGAPPLPVFPYSYLAVEVEEVLASRHGAVKPGDQIVFRVSGWPQHDTTVGNIMLMPRDGDRLLLVLDTTPALPDVYLPTPYGMFNLHGPEVVVNDRDATPVRNFTDQVRAPDFVAALKQAAASRVPQP